MVRDHWQVWIDTGGTFTDCFAIDPHGNNTTLKVLSNSSLRCTVSTATSGQWYVHHNWEIKKDILTGYKVRDLKTQGSFQIKSFDPVNSWISFEPDLTGDHDDLIELSIESEEEVPVFAARILTQTPLKVELPPMKMRLGSTRGTNALLERKGAPTAFMVTKGFRDLIRIGTQQRQDLFSLQVKKPKPYYSRVYEINERLDDNGNVLTSPDVEQIRSIANDLNNDGIKTVAVAFLHSYKNPAHELLVRDILKGIGIQHISLSSQLFNAIKILPRAETAVANAYLSPVIKNYISNIEKTLFAGHEGDLKVMTSAGGLVSSNSFKPKDSLLSGPAGGLVGAAISAEKSGINRILTLDMGGTSTDVARYDHGFDYRYETQVGNARILSPALYIETIAAGGGSICTFDGFRFVVGPESAGAAPGPACYGAGGPLTITDVNLLLGKIDHQNFGIPVHIDAAENALEELRRLLLEDYGKAYSKEEILSGFEQIANEMMAEAIRKISVSRGYDPREYNLLAFGGAGGQHACQVAEVLGMGNVLIPKDAGLLSAYGIGKARIERFAEKQILLPVEEAKETLTSMLETLESQVFEQLIDEGFETGDLEIRQRFFYLRFVGQENTIEVNDKEYLVRDFQTAYEKLYGHWISNREIELESIKVIGANRSFAENKEEAKVQSITRDLEYSHIRNWDGNSWQEIPAYDRGSMHSGANVQGPAVIGSKTSTIYIPRGWKAVIDASNNCLIERGSATVSLRSSAKPEEAELELFSNRFTSVAQEMGAMFQRTSFSVNIKERLDFSCALLDAEGYLVVNAPHIPVHLGSLGICVRKLKEHIPMEEGDVIITNHPGFGGSHLPDITLVSPIFYNNALIGYAANRGHHAEVGGLLPGSTPPHAKSLEEEGVVIEPTYLVRKERARWDVIKRIFLDAPYPTRAIEENMADLNGALASIRMGVEQMKNLTDQYGLDTIRHFMEKIREHAHQALNEALLPFDGKSLKATERLDNDSKLSVSVNVRHPKISFDFSQTSKELKDNFNATPAITTSAVLYVLRLLADQEIPLNEGLLTSVEMILPNNLLNPDFSKPPSECPPVVGGNTETSQRLVDTLIKAFELSGCSQGTMNNLLFGNETFGYYETICGGTGAGNGFHGTDAVHHHMTNTRITDPEIMELRYPVHVKEFSIRADSGGRGLWNGGNGIIRKITFRDKVELTVMSQHRKEAPFGMQGGGPGATGRQWIEKPDGGKISLKGCDSYSIEPGDTIVLQTPGGGGYGKNKTDE